jgi:hypothetical protein
MFGRFKDIESFLDAYVTQHEQKRMDAINALSIEDQIAALRTAVPADLVEVKATIKQREQDDMSTPRHYQMIITLDLVLDSAADVRTDVVQCQQHHLPVFVAIRYGDKMGIVKPITRGMNTGDKMHFKGQWITRDNAYSHGGEKMSVLHYTHHPYGFTCTELQCYS